MKKYLKILVVFLSLFSLLTFSCFATSSQTYGHYISPGYYSFNENVNFSSLPFSADAQFAFRLRLLSDDSLYYGIRPFYGSTSSIYGIGFLRENQSVNIVYDTYNLRGWVDGARQFEVLDGFYITEPAIYQWWMSNTVRINPGYDSSLFDGIFSIFTGIGEWISSAASNLVSMFWVNDSFTFVGLLCVSSLGLAVSFLVFALLQRFLKFRG